MHLEKGLHGGAAGPAQRAGHPDRECPACHRTAPASRGAARGSRHASDTASGEASDSSWFFGTMRSAAARDGRLPVTYDTQTTFRPLRARATLAAVTQFRHAYYGRQVRPADRRVPLTWACVPDDYAEQIRALRRARGLSQAQLATLVGAARKAVVYQWEARKRMPSPLFWQRLAALHR